MSYLTPWFLEVGVEFPSAYNFNEQSGEFVGESRADPSPLEKGVFVPPRFSTGIKPPDASDNQIAVWDGSVWALKPDYRDETWYDENGQEVTIDFIGDPTERGLFADKPVSPEPEPVVPALTARQFWQAALVIGVTEEALSNDVSSAESPLYVADDEERESVLIDIKKTTQFSRDHYLVEKMAKAKDIPTAQLDSLWLWASNIQ